MRISRWFAIFLLMPPAAAPAQEQPSERKASDLVIEAAIRVRGDVMDFADVLGLGLEASGWRAGSRSCASILPTTP